VVAVEQDQVVVVEAEDKPENKSLFTKKRKDLVNPRSFSLTPFSSYGLKVVFNQLSWG
jgi:hypothetical protein